MNTGLNRDMIGECHLSVVTHYVITVNSTTVLASIKFMELMYDV